MMCDVADYNDEYKFIKRSRHGSLNASFFESRKISGKMKRESEQIMPIVIDDANGETRSMDKRVGQVLVNMGRQNSKAVFETADLTIDEEQDKPKYMIYGSPQGILVSVREDSQMQMIYGGEPNKKPRTPKYVQRQRNSNAPI